MSNAKAVQAGGGQQATKLFKNPLAPLLPLPSKQCRHKRITCRRKDPPLPPPPDKASDQFLGFLPSRVQVKQAATAERHAYVTEKKLLNFFRAATRPLSLSPPPLTVGAVKIQQKQQQKKNVEQCRDQALCQICHSRFYCKTALLPLFWLWLVLYVLFIEKKKKKCIDKPSKQPIVPLSLPPLLRGVFGMFIAIRGRWSIIDQCRRPPQPLTSLPAPQKTQRTLVPSSFL